MLHGHSAGPALRTIEAVLGKNMLAKLTPRMVADYRDQRLKAVSGETVRKELGTLSKMIDLAIKEWGIQIPSNPVKQVSKPAPGRPRDRRLVDGEEARLFESLAKCKNHYMLPLVKFALATAARQGELLNMRWSHVNKARKFVMFYDTKNGEDRAQPLSTEALSILDALPRNLHDDRVFPVSQSLVVQAWGHAVKRAEIENLHFHDLRHESLSRLAERGDLSVLELAAVSGHKTLQMLKRYTHLRAEDLAKKLG
jgi:integrase